MKTILKNLKHRTIPNGEYLLTFWGGIENNGLATRALGTESRNFWFETREERDRAEAALKDFGESVGEFVATSVSDGPGAIKQTVAKMDLVYKGKKYKFEYNFGYGHPIEAAEYIFQHGNYACDCNRSMFLAGMGYTITGLEGEGCGDEIEMENFRVELV